MQAHLTQVVVPQSHEVVVRLPDDFPTGQAEVIFLTRRTEVAPPKEPLGAWLAGLHAALPLAPTLPLSALNREDMYE